MNKKHKGNTSHNVLVVGAGYVGLTSAVCLAHLGHEVLCVESNPARLRPLLQGKSPIHEEGLDELLKEGLERGNLRFVPQVQGSLDGIEVVMLCVGTPKDDMGNPDLTQLAKAAREVAAWATSDLVTVIKSTVPPGTCEAIELLCADYTEDKLKISVVSSPEFLRESQAIYDFMNPDRVVIGASNEGDALLVSELYPESDELILTDRRSAELIKYAANAFLAVKISFANEVASVCEALGADTITVLAGVGSDHRIGKEFLRPGPGYGGSCLPKDVAGFQALGDSLNVSTPLVRTAAQINNQRAGEMIDKLEMALLSLSGKTIAVWGLAFKPGTDDARDSPSLRMIDALTDKGAIVQCYDPLAKVENLRALRFDTAADALILADALVITTAWDEFARIPAKQVRSLMRGRVVLDTVGSMDLYDYERAGFTTYGIGRGVPTAFHPIIWSPLKWSIDRFITAANDHDTLLSTASW